MNQFHKLSDVMKEYKYMKFIKKVSTFYQTDFQTPISTNSRKFSI